MNIKVTARHFKAHDSLIEYAEDSVEKLLRYYDGIMKGDVILSFEKARNSVKVAEVILSVYGTKLTGVGRTDDFFKSIDASIEKVGVQLKKYKDRLHAKDRNQVRKIREKE